MAPFRLHRSKLRRCHGKSVDSDLKVRAPQARPGLQAVVAAEPNFGRRSRKKPKFIKASRKTREITKTVKPPRNSRASDSFSRFLALYKFVCVYVCKDPCCLDGNCTELCFQVVRRPVRACVRGKQRVLGRSHSLTGLPSKSSLLVHAPCGLGGGVE